MQGHNHGLRDEIKDYWSRRAETFDQSPGHEIFSEDERQAWHALLLKHLGHGDERRALDLASGTGVISHLMDDLGYRVTGIDWSEAMLERARAKAKARGRAISFFVGDAERTMEASDTYDVVVNRHLVWTLVDPEACFREWFRVLKPGGRLLVVDGDFVNVGRAERAARQLATWLERAGILKTDPMHAPPELAQQHKSILARVHFSKGARADAVADLLKKAGFDPVAIDSNLRGIHRSQAKNWNYFKALARGLQHRYAIVAVKPE
ncbi:class I SAM-dependent methyltransferase (plasmid) [Rhizobium grahamii]|uniref:Class I SAM-dependent methyltransferase n=1 Tax=Rhizobium grahamii TaxID=1120045 RepID=A0A5Q0CD22_9HYPH|nr:MULTISPECIES: class I SAM-dependent methyltransferase [Rhizobium]QFY63748.1 class I SAM-dependent methyltransferase [Rhizobium grahamii]QRM51490.1 class I SAM-dependent methyltransferase [Rhizobium sp. BG6]